VLSEKQELKQLHKSWKVKMNHFGCKTKIRNLHAHR